MITLKITHPTDLDYPKVMKLYEESFIPQERWELVPKMENPEYTSECHSIYQEDTWVGFLTMIHKGNLSHLLFFAIEEGARNKGVGTQTIQAIKDLYPGHRFFGDIEKEDPSAKNNPERIRRRKFYERNGFVLTGLGYQMNGIDFTTIVYGGNLPKQEWTAFWQKMWGHAYGQPKGIIMNDESL